MQALQVTKTLRDSGKVASDAHKAKNLSQANQQLQLAQPSSSPHIITPAQQPPGLNPTALRPGLGFASDRGSPTAAPMLATADEPSSAPGVATAPCHHQAIRQKGDSAVAPQDVKHSAQDTERVKQFCGPLYVDGPKGEELICELRTDSWPAHLAR